MVSSIHFEELFSYSGIRKCYLKKKLYDLVIFYAKRIMCDGEEVQENISIYK